MSDAVWLWFAALSCLLGMAWLALAMENHWAQVMDRPGPATGQSQRLRVLGALALLASFLGCLQADRPSMAVLVWVLFLALAAAMVAMALACQPRSLRRCWPLETRKIEH